MEKCALHRRTAGFTLIEMSIVLVIIGLIVGGILVGNEMIKAAGMRRIISQIESYSTAVQVFRGKYNNYPGDGLEVSSFFPGAVNGNGNGRLECNNTGDPSLDIGLSACTFSQEYARFWIHLSEASLIEGKYDGSPVAGLGFPTTADHRGIIAYYEPATLLPGEHRFAVGARQRLQGVLYDATGGIIPTFSYLDAGAMDRKFDDGMPRTGKITAFGVTAVSCGPSCTQYSYSSPATYDYNPAQTEMLRLYFRMIGW